MRYFIAFIVLISFVFFLSVNELRSQDIGISWEFNEDGNSEGWEPYQSLSNFEVTGGILKATVIGNYECFSGPEFNLAASDYGFIYIRVRFHGVPHGKLIWKTDANISGSIYFPVLGDGLFHEYEIPVHTNQKWAGQIKKISRLFINAETGTVIEIDYVRIVSIGARIELKDYRSLRTVFRQNQPFPLIGVVKNSGDKPGVFIANLLLPEQFALTFGESSKPQEFAAEAEDTLQWTVVSNTPGRFNTTIRLFSEKGDTVESDYEILVQEKTWIHDKFFLSAWSPPAQTDDDYDYYAKANFELLLSVPPNENAVAMVEKYGMRCLLRIGYLIDENLLRAPDERPPRELTLDDLSKLDNIVEQFKNNPTVWGYYITDEPFAPAFPNLAKVVSYLREKDPERLSFINLFGTGEVLEIEQQNWVNYIREFLEIVKPELLSYDWYNFFIDYDNPVYFYDLTTIRTWALKYDVPFCNIIQAIGIKILGPWTFNWRIPTEGEQRWLVYSTLAHGAKAIIYFHWGSSWGLLASPKLDEQYAIIKKLNREINLLGSILIKLTSQNVYHSLNVPMGGTKLPANALVKSVCDNADLVVGLFKDDTDADYIMLMNKDYNKSLTATVTLNRTVEQLEYFDTDTGKWENVNYQNTAEGVVFECNLLAGGGKLFVLGNETGVSGFLEAALPLQFNLEQNHPNPFNPGTTINYSLAGKELVKLAVYDILGCEVAMLVNKTQNAGSYKIHWVANNLPSGVYIYRLQAGMTVISRKMLLLK